jgi:hypothetical protein
VALGQVFIWVLRSFLQNILFHTYLSPPREVCDSPNQTAHCYTLCIKLSVSSLTAGQGVKVLFYVCVTLITVFTYSCLKLKLKFSLIHRELYPPLHAITIIFRYYGYLNPLLMHTVQEVMYQLGMCPTKLNERSVQ